MPQSSSGQFLVVVREPRQNLPSGPWVTKGWEPLGQWGRAPISV